MNLNCIMSGIRLIRSFHQKTTQRRFSSNELWLNFLLISYSIQKMVSNESDSRLQSIITAFRRSGSRMFMKGQCNEHVFDEPFKSSHEWTCWRNNEYFAYKNIPHVLLNWPLQHFYKGEKMEAMKKRYFATKPLAYRKNDGFLRPTNWIVSQQIFPCTQSPLDCWLFSMLWINSVCNQLMNHHLGR